MLQNRQILLVPRLLLFGTARGTRQAVSCQSSQFGLALPRPREVDFFDFQRLPARRHPLQFLVLVIQRIAQGVDAQRRIGRGTAQIANHRPSVDVLRRTRLSCLKLIEAL